MTASDKAATQGPWPALFNPIAHPGQRKNPGKRLKRHSYGEVGVAHYDNRFQNYGPIILGSENSLALSWIYNYRIYSRWTKKMSRLWSMSSRTIWGRRLDAGLIPSSLKGRWAPQTPANKSTTATRHLIHLNIAKIKVQRCSYKPRLNRFNPQIYSNGYMAATNMEKIMKDLQARTFFD